MENEKGRGEEQQYVKHPDIKLSKRRISSSVQQFPIIHSPQSNLWATRRSEPSGIRACPADQGRGRLILWERLPGQQDHVAGMNVANLPRARRASAIGAVDIIAAQQGNGDATRPLVSARMGRLCRKEQKAGDDQAQSWVQTPPEGGRMAL